MNNKIVTRFAPSPTGFLHIGGARTALFNWLFSQNKQGKFLLRIEDTDGSRSTGEAKSAIFKGLEWLDLTWDGTATSQKENIDRHQEIVDQLLKNDMAYRCYATKQDILEFQANARRNGTSTVFRSPWRDSTITSEKTKNSVVRLKSPTFGTTGVDDQIKGKITWKNETLDDLVLLRSDGSPTYMIAVVVDDHDMHVSHVIRGDDHLTNTARQILIYQAMGWNIPSFAHLPLIYGADGTKLSKRHGAIGVSEYEKMGYPSMAFKNYLARLGWSDQDKEYFTMEDVVQWFSLEKVGKSPARFDKKKLDSVSKYHLNLMKPKLLIDNVISFAASQKTQLINNSHRSLLEKNHKMLLERSKTYKEIIENASFLLKKRPIYMDQSCRDLLSAQNLEMLQRLTLELSSVTWTIHDIESLLSSFVAKECTKFQSVAEPLRVALIGQKSSPNIASVTYTIGRKETLDRVSDVLKTKID